MLSYRIYDIFQNIFVNISSLYCKYHKFIYGLCLCIQDWLIVFRKLPIQSIVRAFGLEHPCMQDPLNASQRWFLHLIEQYFVHPGENLLGSQPTNVNYYIRCL